MDNNTKLHTYYFQTVDLWSRLCEEHTKLFETTCQEYSNLLEDNINAIESILLEKEKIILQINVLDNLRTQILKNIEIETGTKITSIQELIIIMNTFEKLNGHKHLWRFNQILIDIIEQIQAQNKKNQMFINKASASLQEIKEEVLGQKVYSTYTSKGTTKNRNIENTTSNHTED